MSSFSLLHFYLLFLLFMLYFTLILYPILLYMIKLQIIFAPPRRSDVTVLTWGGGQLTVSSGLSVGVYFEKLLCLVLRAFCQVETFTWRSSTGSTSAVLIQNHLKSPADGPTSSLQSGPGTRDTSSETAPDQSAPDR